MFIDLGLFLMSPELQIHCAFILHVLMHLLSGGDWWSVRPVAELEEAVLFHSDPYE